ncbi:MAG TPA: DsbA family oxidoreductase [Cyclobacteriaceae bacterium]|nr:DsbA family oxidoreductase [Cyclobacteriaceae bacterium]
MSSKSLIEIEVVSDVVCPWCYIGKRRLQKAVATASDRFDFNITYLPFELNAQLPEEGVGYKAYLSEKFGGEEQFELQTSRVSEVARQEGLIFDHERQEISPNTLRLHALIQAASDQAIQSRIVEGFFKAFFTDGVDLADKANIVSVALAAGMDNSTIEKTLSDREMIRRIRQQERDIYAMGIHSVPFYIINREFGISGAQTAENFIKVFSQATQEKA